MKAFFPLVLVACDGDIQSSPLLTIVRSKAPFA